MTHRLGACRVKAKCRDTWSSLLVKRQNRVEMSAVRMEGKCSQDTSRTHALIANEKALLWLPYALSCQHVQWELINPYLTLRETNKMTDLVLKCHEGDIISIRLEKGQLELLTYLYLAGISGSGDWSEPSLTRWFLLSSMKTSGLAIIILMPQAFPIPWPVCLKRGRRQIHNPNAYFQIRNIHTQLRDIQKYSLSYWSSSSYPSAPQLGNVVHSDDWDKGH